MASNIESATELGIDRYKHSRYFLELPTVPCFVFSLVVMIFVVNVNVQSMVRTELKSNSTIDYITSTVLLVLFVMEILIVLAIIDLNLITMGSQFVHNVN